MIERSPTRGKRMPGGGVLDVIAARGARRPMNQSPVIRRPSPGLEGDMTSVSTGRHASRISGRGS